MPVLSFRPFEMLCRRCPIIVVSPTVRRMKRPTDDGSTKNSHTTHLTSPSFFAEPFNLPQLGGMAWATQTRASTL